MGTTSCVSTDEACFQAGESMFFLMFWLSFPASLPFSIASFIFIGHESIHYPADFITAWMILACGGLLQWFVIVPRLFQRGDLTVLNLREAPPSQSAVSAASSTASSFQVIKPAAIIKPAVQELAAPAQGATLRVQKRPRHKSTPSFTAFDKRGRTPLERVLNRL